MINKCLILPAALGPHHRKQITCFGIADMTGLFEDVSGCQWILHQQGRVGRRRLWLRHQQLYHFGGCCVTWSTVVGLKREQRFVKPHRKLDAHLSDSRMSKLSDRQKQPEEMAIAFSPPEE